MINAQETKQTVSKSRSITAVALMTAVICIVSPFTLPIGPVPIGFANFIIMLAALLLGAKKGFLSCLIFLLLGFAGLPVFSSFSGGVGVLLGPTGGYIIGYLFLALATGISSQISDSQNSKLRVAVILFFGMLIGTAILYAFGTVWFTHQSGMSFTAALSVAVFPFIPGDLIKIVLVLTLGRNIKTRLQGAGLLD
ncbi:MAG: biotin transporter BioY [Clostridia bacterium]|nr:biotin transporter BioY [Clostridia bacterium]